MSNALTSRSEEETTQLKTAFAEALLRCPDDPFAAAFTVIADTGLAMQVATLWVKDKFVIQEQERMNNEFGAKTFLPSKEDQAREVYKLAMEKNADFEDRLKAHRLYAEIMGNIEKPQTNVNTQVNVQQGVMIVRDHGSDDDWEASATQQQQKLITNGHVATC